MLSLDLTCDALPEGVDPELGCESCLSLLAPETTPGAPSIALGAASVVAQAMTAGWVAVGLTGTDGRGLTAYVCPRCAERHAAGEDIGLGLPEGVDL